MSEALKSVQNMAGWQHARFLVTNKHAPGTKKPTTKKPATEYEYVQSVATHYREEGCAGIKAKYSALYRRPGFKCVVKWLHLRILR